MWRGVDCVDVCMAVVQAVGTSEGDVHCQEAVCTVKPDGPRTSILETCLDPCVEYVAGSQYRLWRDYCLNDISAKETELPIYRAVGALEWNITAFRTAIVHGYFAACKCDGDWHWRDVDHANHAGEVTCNANIGASVHQLC